MTIVLKNFVVLLPLAAAACGPSTSVQHTNAQTTAELNEISENTSEHAGASQSAAPLTPNEVGQSMREGAGSRPRGQ